jgi:hypothetical protein
MLASVVWTFILALMSLITASVLLLKHAMLALRRRWRALKGLKLLTTAVTGIE